MGHEHARAVIPGIADTPAMRLQRAIMSALITGLSVACAATQSRDARPGVLPVTAPASGDAGGQVLVAVGKASAIACDETLLYFVGNARQTRPTAVDHGIRSIDVAGSSHCAVDGSGAATCWRDLRSLVGPAGGMPALGGDEEALANVGVERRVAIASGAHRIVDAGDAVCWAGRGGVDCMVGLDFAEGAGTDAALCPTLPVSVKNERGDLLGDVVEMDAFGNNVCAVSNDGSVWCWSTTFFGQCRSATPTPAGAAWKIPFWGNARKVAMSWGVTCALLDDGTVECFGCNQYGELGTTPAWVDTGRAPQPYLTSEGPSFCPSTRCLHGEQFCGEGPTRIPLSAPASDVQCGETYCCALSGADVACWGNNHRGQLGRGAATFWSLPGRVPLPHRVAALGVGHEAACALTEERQLWCWGGNVWKTLGNDDVSAFSAQPIVVADDVPCRAAGASK